MQSSDGKSYAAAKIVGQPRCALFDSAVWDELTGDLDPREFTIETAPARFDEVGDIWAAQLWKKDSLRALV